MQNEYSRTELLIGKKALNMLRQATVAVFGIGGVGSFTVEALARSAIGHIVMIDDDVVCLTNINRQLHATHKTIGLPKVDIMKERILAINPTIKVTTRQAFYLPDTGENLISKDYDYIVDAIDTVTAKIGIVLRAKELNIPLISCMGTGKKMDPTKFEIADIFDTSVCPLCKVMRTELRKRGIDRLKVVYSKEPAHKSPSTEEPCCSVRRRDIPGSISFVPGVAGMIAASAVIRDLLAKN